MIDQTILKIQKLVESADHLNEDQKKELILLSSQLKHEVLQLDVEHQDKLKDIVGYTELTTIEYLRTEHNPEMLDEAEKNLLDSIEHYEESHPDLYQAVQAICFALRGLGV